MGHNFSNDNEDYPDNIDYKHGVGGHNGWRRGVINPTERDNVDHNTTNRWDLAPNRFVDDEVDFNGRVSYDDEFFDVTNPYPLLANRRDIPPRDRGGWTRFGLANVAGPPLEEFAVEPTVELYVEDSGEGDTFVLRALVRNADGSTTVKKFVPDDVSGEGGFS